MRLLPNHRYLAIKAESKSLLPEKPEFSKLDPLLKRYIKVGNALYDEEVADINAKSAIRAFEIGLSELEIINREYLEAALLSKMHDKEVTNKEIGVLFGLSDLTVDIFEFYFFSTEVFQDRFELVAYLSQHKKEVMEVHNDNFELLLACVSKERVLSQGLKSLKNPKYDEENNVLMEKLQNLGRKSLLRAELALNSVGNETELMIMINCVKRIYELLNQLDAKNSSRMPNWEDILELKTENNVRDIADIKDKLVR